MKDIKKRLLVVLCMALCVVCACAFVACNHAHSYTEIGSDDTQHWYYCKDDNTVDSSTRAAHTDSDNDGKCDVCGHAIAAQHTHDYTEVGSDDTHHWNKCACGAIDEASKANHVDDNKDGKCDVCAHTVPIPHEHSYTEVGSDDTHHWNECSCGAIDESSKVNHVDADKSGKCDVCKHKVPVSHDHEYTKGGKNETQHWNECACGAIDESSKANHVDDNKDGKCDVCNEHVHNYAIVDCDDARHWNKCACGAIDESSNANHADTDGDDLCDGCKTHCHEHTFTFESESFVAPDGEKDGSITIDCLEEDGFCYYKGGKTVPVKILAFGEEVKVQSNTPVFYYIAEYFDEDTYESWYIPASVSFEIGNTTTVEYFYATWSQMDYDTWEETVHEEWFENPVLQAQRNIPLLEEGQNPDSCLFRVSATDGNISFKMQNPYGSYDNPISIQKNTKYNSIGYVYYTYTADATEELWLVCDNGGVSVTVGYDIYSFTRYTKIPVVEGTTYEICVGFDTANAFKLTTEIPGVGDTYELALNLLSTFSHYAAERYYRFNASEDGRLTIDITNDLDYTVYYQETTSGIITYQQYYGMPYLSAGDSVWILVGNSGKEAYTITASTKPLVAVDNTFTVKDNKDVPIAGVTVTVNGVSGVTDAEGKVVLNFVPGNYTIELSDYDSSLIYSGMSTKWDDEDAETDGEGYYQIVLKGLLTKTFVVKDSKGNPVKNAYVVLYNNSGKQTEIKRSALTGEDGKATISDSFETYRYRIGIIADDYYTNKSQVYGSVLSDTTEDYVITATDKPVYTFTVTAPEGVSVDGATISIIDYNGNTIGTGKITNGVATIKIAASISSYYSISVSGLPTGYSFEEPDLSAAAVTLSIVEATPPTGTQLALGDNTVELELDDDWVWTTVKYNFTSEAGGAYTLTLTDTLGGAAVYVGDSFEPVVYNDGYEAVWTYTFVLEAGESITFEAMSENEEAYTHEYTLTLAAATLATSLKVGSNYVQGMYMGNSLTFTSEEGGQFKISSENDNFFCWLSGDEESTVDAYNPYTFTLDAGGSITFVFSTYDYSASDNYLVTIERVYR